MAITKIPFLIIFGNSICIIFSLSTNNKTGTIIIYISITSYDPIVSVKLANAYVTASIDIINENPEGSLKSLAQAEPGPLDEAYQAKASNSLVKNCVVGTAAGVVVAAAGEASVVHTGRSRNARRVVGRIVLRACVTHYK